MKTFFCVILFIMGLFLFPVSMCIAAFADGISEVAKALIVVASVIISPILIAIWAEMLNTSERV